MACASAGQVVPRGGPGYSLPMCPGGPLPAQPSPGLLESAVWSGHVCHLSPLLSQGSVLTGVSRAGSAVASSAPAREGELEEGLKVLPGPLSHPSWSFRGAHRCSRGLWPPGSPLALLRRRPSSCLQDLHIWLGLKHPNSNGHDFNPGTAILRALTSQSGVRLSRVGPGRSGGRALG